MQSRIKFEGSDEWIEVADYWGVFSARDRVNLQVREAQKKLKLKDIDTVIQCLSKYSQEDVCAILELARSNVILEMEKQSVVDRLMKSVGR